MKQWTLVLALALAAAPAAAHAQGSNNGRADGPRAGARRAAPGRALAANPLQFLVTHASDLKLTPSQIDRIRTREAQLQAKNRPLMEKLQAARGQRAGQPRPAAQPDREAMRKQMAELRPAMEQVRKNGADAWKDALGYLTKDQVKQAQQLRQSGMRARRGPGAQAGRGENRAQGRPQGGF
jgi:hypothetical protein